MPEPPRPGQEEAGVRVPVVALVKRLDETRYVRLGGQFCVPMARRRGDPRTPADFSARLHSPLQLA